MTADAGCLLPDGYDRADKHQNSRTDGVSRPFCLCKIEKREGK